MAQEVKAQQTMLERARLEKHRTERAHDPLTAKYDALMRAKPTAAAARALAVGGGGWGLVGAGGARAQLVNS